MAINYRRLLFTSLIVQKVIERLENVGQVRAQDRQGFLCLANSLGGAIESVAAVEERYVDYMNHDYLRILDHPDTIAKV